MSRPGPPDQEDNGGAGGHADRETLQQRPAALRLHRACPGPAGGQALINTCGDLLVNFRKERGHDRVAVLGAQLMVRAGGGADVLRGQRRSTHEGRLTLTATSKALLHAATRARCAVGKENGTDPMITMPRRLVRSRSGRLLSEAVGGKGKPIPGTHPSSVPTP